MKEKHNISFYYLNILIMLLVLLPKRSEILEMLPFRTGLIFLF